MDDVRATDGTTDETELHGDGATQSPTAQGSPELHGDNPPQAPAKAVDDEAAEGSASPLSD